MSAPEVWIPIRAAAALTGRDESRIRHWLNEGLLTKVLRDRIPMLVEVNEVRAVEARMTTRRYNRKKMN